MLTVSVDLCFVFSVRFMIFDFDLRSRRSRSGSFAFDGWPPLT